MSAVSGTGYVLREDGRYAHRTGRRAIHGVAMSRRRTLFLTGEQDEALESISQRRQVPVSQVVREAVDDLIDREGTQ